MLVMEQRGTTLGGTPTSPQILVLVDEDREATALDAVFAAEASVIGSVRWADAPARLVRQGLVKIVLADASGADDALVAQALPLLDAVARNGDARVVLSFAVDQIDLVAANIADPGVTLLCNPSASEQVVALYLTGASGSSAVNDVGREAEAMRLRRLNEEVARIADTLARLTRSDPAPRAEALYASTVGERSLGYRVGPIAAAGDEAAEITPREVRDAIRTRRLRDQFFGAGLFEDPAWDMLLDLFAAELERAQVSVSSLCIAAAVAPTTALRWIARMTDAGLFVRHPDPFDRRRAFMGLSDRASAGMRSYVAAARRIGVGIA